MSTKAFLRDKLIFIFIVIITVAVGALLLGALDFPVNTIFLLCFIYAGGGFAAAFFEYAKKRSYYKKLFATLESLKEKHYISEIMEAPDFAEGRAFAEVLEAAGKSMNDEIAEERAANREYREYVELWVHEVKTPISAAKLICDNNGYKNVSDEVDRIEKYVEQALFYARAGSVEKDYIIKKVEVKKLVAGLLKKNAGYLISKGVRVEPEAEGEVSADSKWLTFILQQLLDNSVKYGAKTISFGFDDDALTIGDDGLGIPPQDLPRVFDRGFTGENGRGSAQSTGMGLYLCKQLCGKMGLGISAVSEPGNGTKMRISFPKNPFASAD